MGRWDHKENQVVWLEKKRFYTMLGMAGTIGALIAGMVVTAFSTSC